MPLIRNEIPILEYDDSQNAVIMPNRKNQYRFPARAVFPFLADEVERYARAAGCEQIGEFLSATKVYPIYRAVHRGEEVCLCQAPVGAAAAAQLLDFLIGYGARFIVSAGTCGTLTERAENAFLIPVEALRCEGASYHYLPASRTVRMHAGAVKAVEQALEENGIPHCACMTWSTDGFYRETREMVEYRVAEGFTVVEMECSALIACAEFRGAVFGQFLFTADTLANVEAHDERDWGAASFSTALKVCMDAAVRLGEDGL